MNRNRKFTRAQRKESSSELNNSAIKDHIVEENHVNDWEGAKILDRDSNQFTRKIRETIWIHKRGSKTMNHDVGSITLDHGSLLRTSHPRKETTVKLRGKSSDPNQL